jgi:hypothetical protein
MRSIFFAGFILALVVNGPATAGEVLIKPEEAALPPAPAQSNTRALTRKPEVILISPAASVNSPFELRLKFEAHGGSRIEPSSFHLIYLKSPNIDLTERVRRYVTAQGLEMVDAEAPPGQHTMKALITDSGNREGSAVFTVSIK